MSKSCFLNRGAKRKDGSQFSCFLSFLFSFQHSTPLHTDCVHLKHVCVFLNKDQKHLTIGADIGSSLLLCDIMASKHHEFKISNAIFNFCSRSRQHDASYQVECISCTVTLVDPGECLPSIFSSSHNTPTVFTSVARESRPCAYCCFPVSFVGNYIFHQVPFHVIDPRLMHVLQRLHDFLMSFLRWFVGFIFQSFQRTICIPYRLL